MPTLTLSVAVGDDDFFEENGVNYSSFSDLLYAGVYGGPVSEHLMCRFAVALSSANVISTATWRLYSPGGTQTGAPQLRAYGEAADTAADRAGALVNSRAKTTAFQTVNISAGAYDSAGWVEIDVKSIVQEIIARGGWASGNYVGLMLINQAGAATNEIGFEDVAAAGGNESELVIVYDVGGGAADLGGDAQAAASATGDLTTNTGIAGDAAAAASASATLHVPNLGILISDIYQPNSASLVADATGVAWAVFDKAPDGTEVRRVGGAAGVITNGDMLIDDQAVGALGGTGFVTLRWIDGANEITYSATETIIDIDA